MKWNVHFHRDYARHSLVPGFLSDLGDACFCRAAYFALPVNPASCSAAMTSFGLKSPFTSNDVTFFSAVLPVTPFTFASTFFAA